MEQTESLRKIPENLADKVLALGIMGKVKLLVMHTQTNDFVVLPPGQLQNISNKHPAKAMVVVERAPKVDGYYQGEHHLQDLTYRDLWINASDYYLVDEPEKLTTGELLENNSYWKYLRQKACLAIDKFDDWYKKQNKVQKTANLEDWIKKEITKNTREIYFIKKILEKEFNL